MGPEEKPDVLEIHLRIRILCPRISRQQYEITSKSTSSYNCVAWSLGIVDRWWEPTPGGQYYWPNNRFGDYSLAAFKAMFEEQGFEECLSEDLEVGFDKIVLYGVDGEFLHVALQTPAGSWSSKLGDLEDIEHSTAQAIAGGAYGEIAAIMRRTARDPRLLI